ncbi:MAG: enoyl-CoA hydratase/isomerase family protein [Actinobacteria bacterium]|nr:enoyl-CoA hydratase/isomerase family protein [Actinomycetota bacterium]
MDELVRYELADGIARITLDRPETRNALTGTMRDRIGDLFDAASADLNVRVVVLAATGKGFCTGADLRGVTQDAPPRPEGAPERAVGEVARVIQRGWQRLVTSVLDCEKPVIGAIQGIAAGGGMHLALACDLVIAAESARFISVFVRRGIGPDAAGAYLLTRLVGIQRAKELTFLGDDVHAEQAQDMGLINRVVPDDELAGAVEELAQRLSEAPTQAIAASKRLINRALDVDRSTALIEEAWAQEAVTHTHDIHEGTMSFIEKRDPDFKGW